MSSPSPLGSDQQAAMNASSDASAVYEPSLTIAWFCNKFGQQEESHVEATSPSDRPTVPAFRVPAGAFPDSTPATSARALMDILALKTSLVTVIPSPQPGLLQAEDVISEVQLRALFMKALTWYLERECINLSDAYVVLVGQEVGESTRVNHPAIPVATVRLLAAEQGIESADGCLNNTEFDSFMFHAEGFSPAGYGRNLRLQEGIMVLVSTVVTFFLGFYLARMGRTLLG